ncbi:hypothetical protein HPB51_017919 [Rhipicephalus microplus]|uniref:Uncharacterized protein n=1 Tax=Rhipicephalus microplus TaxID=6941 RepID=A0A9J6EPR6_RHIMP|nr:hypothetical protein HPB51_017919 [Rhipicephalus microplus]
MFSQFDSVLCRSTRGDPHRITHVRFFPVRSFIIGLAKVVGVTADPSLVMTRMELYTKMKVAVVEGHQKQASFAKSRGVIQAQDLDFRGVGRNAFGDAVESKTPYSRSSRLFLTPILVAMLESVWRALSGNGQLFSWTSWHVADALVHFVEPAYTKAKQWFSTFRAAPNVYVGSPVFARYYNAMDVFFSKFPSPNTSGRHFLVQWAAAAQAWRTHPLPAGLYFDAMETALDVATNDTIIVPAILTRRPFFDQERLVAANVGTIGHLIAMTLAERYLLPNVSWPAACQSPPGSRDAADDSIASLLAYECSLEALVAMGGDKDQQLPRFGELSPERMLFISGCYKDCVFHRTASSRCPSSPTRLKAFRQAFWCDHLEPACVLT